MYEAAVVILHRVKRSLRLKDWAVAVEQRSGPGKAPVALARQLSVIRTVSGDLASRSAGNRKPEQRRASELVRSVAGKRVAPGEGAGNCTVGAWARGHT
jgi:hypothetical protein